MRVLVACEFSGTVRDAFARRGHDAWSCDLLPTESPGNHIVGDCLDVVGDGWDLMVCHPPCTHLCAAGAMFFHKKKKRQRRALEFVLALLNAPIPMICLENPVGVISTRICRPTQVVHPWQFGHDEEKTTCLWLKNLPRLRHTKVCKTGSGWRYNKLNCLSPSPDRWKKRSKTFDGIASAMATQWGRLPPTHTTGFGLYHYRLRSET